MNLAMMPVIPLPKRSEPRSEHDVRTAACNPLKLWENSISQASSWRVKADVTIPALTTAGPYPSEVLIGMNTVDNPKTDNTIKVTVSDGLITAMPGNQPPCHWLLCVTPARDRHEQNLEAVRDSRGMIVFRAIKEITRGSELLVWYSAELAMECGIPILTPLNIKSDQDYVCSGCDVAFRYPNTLKAHIRFHCSRNPVTSFVGQYSPLQASAGSLLSAYQYELSKYFCQLGTLWNLRKMNAVDHGASRMSPEHGFNPIAAAHPTKSAFRPCNGPTKSLSPAFSPSQSPLAPGHSLPDKTSSRRSSMEDHHKKHLSEDLTRRPNKSGLPGHGHYPSIPAYLDKLYMYNYANCMRSDFPGLPTDLTRSFQRVPFTPGADFSAATHQNPLLATRGLTSSSARLPETVSPKDRKHSPRSDRDSSPTIQMPAVNFPMPSETAGEPIDLLPKSLYMSKAYKGHLCIYCGKLYSRKYGLKIHLRTHTGYKPLKCKVCLRPFGDPSNLNKHIRLHAEGDTPYRCNQCGKVLVRRRDLERHIKSRHPQEGLSVLTDENTDTLCDTDNSFIDVDDDGENIDDIEGPLDMSRHDIEVS